MESYGYLRLHLNTILSTYDYLKIVISLDYTLMEDFCDFFSENHETVTCSLVYLFPPRAVSLGIILRGSVHPTRVDDAERRNAGPSSH